MMMFFELIKPVLKALPTPSPTPMVPDAGAAGISILMLMWIVAMFFYFIPSIAGWRKRDKAAIFILNFFLGWTFIGWVVALVWACREDRPERYEVVVQR